MGRKKKKVTKPWCWYCNREFDDEKILLQHQKAKHFKCHICHKKLFTGPGLSIHCMQVHKEQIDKVPNALPNRSNIEIEIYGMEGIPDEDAKEHERQKQGKSADDDDDGPPEKVAKIDHMPGGMMPGPMPGMMPGMPPGPGMVHPSAPRMLGGHIQPLMSMQPISPMGMPSPFMSPGMMGGPMMAPGRLQMPVMSTVASAIQAPTMKPLFPVSASSSGSGSTAVGSDFKPLSSSSAATFSAPPKPTFPAYGSESSESSGEPKSNATISAEPTVKRTINTLTTSSGATSRIIHPEEDISLEERRARMPKYQALNTAVGDASHSGPSHMMRPGMNPGQRPPFGNVYQSPPNMMQHPRMMTNQMF